MCLLGCILLGTATVGIFFNLLDTVGLFEASKFWKLVGSCFCYRQNSQRALEFWGSDIVWRKDSHTSDLTTLLQRLWSELGLYHFLFKWRFCRAQRQADGFILDRAADISQVEFSSHSFSRNFWWVYLWKWSAIIQDLKSEWIERILISF